MGSAILGATAAKGEREPIRGELYGADRLAAHAREIAGHHRVAPPVRGHSLFRRRPALLLARLDATERLLADVRQTLADAVAAGRDPTPAGIWLLDNFFVIADQVREIRATLPIGYYRELPKLLDDHGQEGYPRVYDIAIELIAHTDGRLDAQSVELMIREYQTVSLLTIGELWAIPRVVG